MIHLSKGIGIELVSFLAACLKSGLLGNGYATKTPKNIILLYQQRPLD